MARYINEQNSDADKQAVLRFPKGVDQVSAETELLPGAARRIVNLDVHRGAEGPKGSVGGRLAARSRVEKIISGTNVHSLWSGVGDTYYVDAGSLKHLSHDLVVTGVRSGVGDQPMYFTEVAGNVFYSNGVVSGTLIGTASYPWGMPLPAAPVASVETSGGLAAGTYMVAYTYLDSANRESGASPTSIVPVAEGGGIRLAIPAGGTRTIRVYVSPPNGDELYWAHNIAAGATYSYVGTHQPGKPLLTKHMQAPEPCTCLESYNGRVYGAVGNVLVATQALNYFLTRPSTDFVMFPENITMIKAGTDGLYVGTPSGVEYLAGKEMGQYTIGSADTLPPIPGSEISVDGALFGEPGRGIVWLTRRGWVFGGAGGRVKRLTESQMALPQYDRAASLYREHDGMRQVMTFVKGGGEAAGASDSYDTEIVRNGRIV